MTGGVRPVNPETYGSPEDFRFLPEFVRTRIETLAGLTEHVIVIACSGGIDSVVLADAIAHSGLKHLVLAHVDHGIRTRPERKRDMVVLKHLSKRLNITLKTRAVEEGVLKIGDSKEGVEALARSYRYRLLAEMAAEAGEEAGKEAILVTAHHWNDQAETVLMRILTGRSPLASVTIPEYRVLSGSRIIVVRPLLNVKPEILRRYAEKNGVEWHEDSTNNNTRYTRNYIRGTLLPEILRRFPGAMDSIGQYGNEVDLLRRGLHALIPSSSWGSVDEGRTWRLSMKDIKRIPKAAREIVLRHALYEISNDHRVSFVPFRDFLDRYCKVVGTSSEEYSVSASDVVLTLRNGILELCRDIVPILESRYLWVVTKDSPYNSATGVTVTLNSGGNSDADCVLPVVPPVIIRTTRRDSRPTAGSGDFVVVEDTHGAIATIGPDRTYTLRDGVKATHILKSGVPYISVQFDS